MTNKRQIRQRGENSLLREIQRRFQVEDKEIIQPIGDDCAVLSIKDKNILITTDMMNEGIHFDPSYTSGYSIGFKLISVNVSDIYSMGGMPVAVFLNVGIPPKTTETFFWDFYDGIDASIKKYNIKLLGGDLCAVKKYMTFSATVIGKVDRHVLRRGACIGDLVCVSGSLGDSALGLHMLKHMSKPSQRFIKRYRDFSLVNNTTVEITTLKGKENLYLKEILPFILHHLCPMVKRLEVVERFATSCIDLSDGLSIDVNRICDESGVGVCIDLKKIPVSRGFYNYCEMFGLDADKLLLNGGEDYRLLFTLPRYVINDGISPKNNEDFHIIGEITKDNRYYIDEKGKEYKLIPQGFEHFE